MLISPVPCTSRRGLSLLMLPIVPKVGFRDVKAAQSLHMWVVEPLSRIHEKHDNVLKVIIYDECSDTVSEPLSEAMA